MVKYILDTNVLITAYRINYPFDVMPSFWNNLLAHAKKETFYLTREVLDEIERGNDELSQWFFDNADCFTILDSDNSNVIGAYQKIIDSAYKNPQYTISAKEEFARIADSWIIAHALAYNHVIVTEEVFQKNIKWKIKIPNICYEFSIGYTNTIGFMRSIGIVI
ncbi:MAG: DUF4411 family protein [Bacillota bacterium]